jgi:hypothetical protein
MAEPNASVTLAGRVTVLRFPCRAPHYLESNSAALGHAKINSVQQRSINLPSLP